MTDDRQTTTDAIKSLERALAYFDFPPGQPQPGYYLAVDEQTLALALAEFDAARARVSALEAALRDVCEATSYVLCEEGEYFGGCNLCHTSCDDGGVIHHAPDCPIAAALALLEDTP